ncbi:MAG: hypothetical protein JSS82_16080 [Bacteroidetes bacterium]|nr:hypothetical protein [Bacteroidota bacterium]
MDAKIVPANIQQLHRRGQLSDDEYQLIALAIKIKACRLRTDTIENSREKNTMRFEITLVKDVK